MFTLRQYLTTLADTHGLTRTLGEIEVCRDGKGRICYSAGNSAVVFRIRCEGRVRSLRCYMHHPRHLAEIYGEKLLPQELFIYTSPAGGVWVDVVLSDWIEGVTLHEAVAAAAEAEIDMDQVDWFVPHQANQRIIGGVVKRLSLDESKVVSTIAMHGNTSAASIPLAWSVAKADGRIKEGDLVIIEGMGGGLTWGAAVIQL